MASASASAPAPAPAAPAARPAATDVLGLCETAAKAILGPNAEVLRCGNLNRRESLEVVAIQRKHKKHGVERDIFASRLIILRRDQAGWIMALDVSRGLKNEAGYIATDYVDDGAPVWGYRVQLHDTLPDDNRRQFTLEVATMHDETDGWASGTEIAWDRRVGRYREYNTDNGPGAFQPENANPHLGPAPRKAAARPANATARPAAPAPAAAPKTS